MPELRLLLIAFLIWKTVFRENATMQSPGWKSSKFLIDLGSTCSVLSRWYSCTCSYHHRHNGPYLIPGGLHELRDETEGPLVAAEVNLLRLEPQESIGPSVSSVRVLNELHLIDDCDLEG